MKKLFILISLAIVSIQASAQSGWAATGCPDGLTEALHELNDEEQFINEEITSIAFNDVGDWIAVSTEHIAASSRELQDWVADGMDYYGAVLATCITEDAAVVVYEEGYRFLGDVPQDLKRRLETVSFTSIA